MTSNSDEAAARRAIERLEGLGLSVYAARTFVGLVTLGGGTAKEISETVNVPRTRVYDAAEELAEQGLATVESSTPRTFHPVSIGQAIRVFSTEYTSRIDEVATDLETLGATDVSGRRDDLWSLTGSAAIRDQIEQLVAGAEASVFFATTRPSLPESTVDSLVSAAERGVTVRIAGVPSGVSERFESAAPGVETLDRPWDPSALDIATVLIVDDAGSLVRLDRAEPYALWSVDEPNHLLALLRALLELPA